MTDGTPEREMKRRKSARTPTDGYSVGRRLKTYPLGAVPGTELTHFMLSERVGTRGESYGWFLCSCGSFKELRCAYVFSETTTTCADRKHHLDPRMAERPSIRTAHNRVARERGPASTHPCAICGVTAKGNHWAYRHSSLDPLVQQGGKDAGQVYSTDLSDYWALCRGHHSQWDSKIDKEATSLAHVALAMAYQPYG